MQPFHHSLQKSQTGFLLGICVPSVSPQDFGLIFYVLQVFSLHYDVEQGAFLDDADVQVSCFETPDFVSSETVLAHALVGTGIRVDLIKNLISLGSIEALDFVGDGVDCGEERRQGKYLSVSGQKISETYLEKTGFPAVVTIMKWEGSAQKSAISSLSTSLVTISLKALFSRIDLRTLCCGESWDS